MSEAIIEAAARALTEHSVPFANMRSIAEAVVTAVTPLIEAAALEKAARVAEEYDGEFEEVHMAQGDIAAAIRALIPNTPMEKI